MPILQPPPRSASRQSLTDRRAPTPPDMPLPQPPRTTSRQSRLSAMSPPPVLVRGATRQPRPSSSIYSSHSPIPRSPRSPVPPPRSPPPSSPVPQSPRGFGPNPLTLFPRPTPSPRPMQFPRQVTQPSVVRVSPSPSVSSSDGSDYSSGSLPPRGRTRRPPPPPINMEAVTERQQRGSLTSLPDLLDRATRLYDVLSTGRTTSMMANEGMPRFGRESTVQEEDPNRRPPHNVCCS